VGPVDRIAELTKVGGPVGPYLPEVHYHQVRDAWHGLRTPSGQ